LVLLTLAIAFAASARPDLPSPALAEGPQARGVAIFAERDRRNSGWQDYQVELTMILRDALGSESARALRIRQLEVPEDGDKLMIVFDTPKPIRGTALLSYGHKTEPDDQWLYLPALQRVKKIASRNKSGPFLGSEFSFEDLSSQEVEKFSYRFLREEARDGVACYVIERVPLDKYSGYTRQEVWLDQAELRMLRVHYFDRKASHLKTLTFSDYRRYEDAFWRAGRMFMQNHQSGKSTELIWGDYAFRTGLQDTRDFSTNSLKRVN
jgi:hypothetical protein